MGSQVLCILHKEKLSLYGAQWRDENSTGTTIEKCSHL